MILTHNLCQIKSIKIIIKENEQLSDGLGQQASFTSNSYCTHTFFTTNSALKFAFMRTREFDELVVMGKCADKTNYSQ